MTNSYQALKRIIILTVSLKQALGQNEWENSASLLQTGQRHLQTSALCDDETVALGPLGDYDALVGNLDLTTDCALDMTSGLTYACDLKDDTFTACMDAGGQHHVMDMVYDCSVFMFTGTNIGLCVGASCDIDKVAERAIANITYAMPQLLASLASTGMSLSTEGCKVPTIEFTQSSPAGSTQPGGSGDSDDGNSGSHANGVGLLFYGLVTVLPILLLV